MQKFKQTQTTLIIVILIGLCLSTKTGVPNFENSPKKRISKQEFISKQIKRQNEQLPDHMFRNVPLQKREQFEHLHKLITIDTHNRMNIGNNLMKKLGTLEPKYIDKTKWRLSLNVNEDNSQVTNEQTNIEQQSQKKLLI